MISREEFEQLVGEAYDKLQDKYKDRINNLVILVEDFPTKKQMKEVKVSSEYGLLGLYEGYIQSRRINIGVVLPDKITLFYVPIAKSCSDTKICKQRIENTLRHEIAHHFGSDEKGARKASLGK
jgi:predicted Zn-dependent protease with MMP-like domain